LVRNPNPAPIAGAGNKDVKKDKRLTKRLLGCIDFVQILTGPRGMGRNCAAGYGFFLRLVLPPFCPPPGQAGPAAQNNNSFLQASEIAYFCAAFTQDSHTLKKTAFARMELKKVALNDLHASLGAKMVPFAGYYMPVRYSSDLDEHHAVRKAVGIFDVSHMGEFLVQGPGALDLIQRVTSNDAAKLTDGKVQYSCLPNEDGGIVDDLLVYRFGEEDYMLVVNASNIEKDWNWISNYNLGSVTMKNVSDEISLFAVQGPKAVAALQPLTALPLDQMAYYTFAKGEFAGVPEVIVSATGYTGAGGFEIYVPNAHARTVWDKIMAAGQAHGIKPIGLGARDTLRLEMGFCLYGNDITDATSPLEAGLGWITKFTKRFTNCESLQHQKEAGIARRLVGFEMQEQGIPRGHYEILNAAGEAIGEVTSGTQSPSLGKGVGLGYVPVSYSAPGTELLIQVRNRQLKAQVVKLPFVKPEA
jgi:aminomethyltransferase